MTFSKYTSGKQPFGVLLVITLLFFVIFINSCSDNPTSPAEDDPVSVQDVDGNTYPVVRIGEQLWMSENLRAARYANGDSIRHVPEFQAWNGLNEGAWVLYANNSSNLNSYGKLYNWFAATDSRGICPDGWKVPSDQDWQRLEIHLGMSAQHAGYSLGRGGSENVGGKMKSTSMWQDPNEGATNESGFNGRPGGRLYPTGGFSGLNGFGYWWSTTEYNPAEAYSRNLFYQNGEVYRSMLGKRNGISIRCIKA